MGGCGSSRDAILKGGSRLIIAVLLVVATRAAASSRSRIAARGTISFGSERRRRSRRG